MWASWAWEHWKEIHLGKIEGRNRREQWRMRWLDGITDSMDMSLSKLQFSRLVQLFAIPRTAASLSITNSWSLLKLQSFPASGYFPMSPSGGQCIGVAPSTSILPMNIEDWFPLGLTGWISFQSKRLSRVFSKPQFKNINYLVLSFPYGPTLTSIHDCWKNHSFD